MARSRRELNVFSLSFLDAMTCGFGAVVLFYMIINASFGRTSGRMTAELHGEVDKLEVEVLEGYQNLVELKNSLREIDQEKVIAAGLSRRLIETLTIVREELATYENTTLATREHVNKLKGGSQIPRGGCQTPLPPPRPPKRRRATACVPSSGMGIGNT